jgi:SSS family solute:Na+ symporter
MIQRFSTAKSVSHARRSFIITAISDVVWMILLFVVGLALVAYIKVEGELPAWVDQNADRIFPYVMADIFPIGVTGLVLAAILAASLSSVDSAINSLTTVGMVDFYRRLVLHKTDDSTLEDPEEQRRQVLLSRLLTILVGAVGITLACYVDSMGNLFDLMFKILNTFAGIMLAIFWLGMFTKRATSFSTILGAVAGIAIALLLSFSETMAVGAIWVAPAGLIITMGVGMLFGSAQYSEAAQRWNWYAIMQSKATVD